MPTPFTHMEINQRLLEDTAIPEDMRLFLASQLPAYSLGSVAADARVGSGIQRATTHFYNYADDIPDHPWRVMTRQNPRLMTPHDDAHRAFIAAYVAHISVDEVWTLLIVRPHFARREWAERNQRFYMLHILLTYMDERDRYQIAAPMSDSLCDAKPHNWLDFISDADLRKWQSMIYEQVKPNGESQTLQIFGERIGVEAQQMRNLLDSPQQMRRQLWQYVSRDFLAQVEAACYNHARQQMIAYLNETQ